MTAIGQQNPILLFSERQRITVAALHHAQLGLQEDHRCRVVVAVFVVGLSEMKRKASNSSVREIVNIKI